MAPVNNWLHSLFSQVDVYLSGTLVTPSTNTYPYRAYIETLLSYGSEAKETQLTSQLWYKDTAGRMDSVKIVDEDVMNRGLVFRRAHVTQSRVVDMMGRLHAVERHMNVLLHLMTKNYPMPSFSSSFSLFSCSLSLLFLCL